MEDLIVVLDGRKDYRIIVLTWRGSSSWRGVWRGYWIYRLGVAWIPDQSSKPEGTGTWRNGGVGVDVSKPNFATKQTLENS